MGLIEQGAAKEELIAVLQKKIADLESEVGAAEKSATEAQEQLSAFKKNVEQAEFEGVFKLALENSGGKILPAEKEKFQKMYSADRDFVLEVFKKFSVATTGKRKMENVQLSLEDSEIMRERGLDPNNPDHMTLFQKAQGGR